MGRGVTGAARCVAIACLVLMLGGSAREGTAQDDSGLALDALKQAYAALDDDDPDAAETAFRSALDRANTSELRYNALFGLGSVLAATARGAEAEPVLAEAAALRPDRAAVWVLLGDVRRGLQRPEGAARAWTAALTADPDQPDVYVKLGVLYEELGQHGAAESTFSRGALRFPRDPEMLLGLGVARLHAGRASEAAAAFRAALQVAPDSPRAVYGLGVAQLEMGDRDGAAATHARLVPLSEELARDLADRLAGD